MQKIAELCSDDSSKRRELENKTIQIIPAKIKELEERKTNQKHDIEEIEEYAKHLGEVTKVIDKDNETNASNNLSDKNSTTS